MHKAENQSGLRALILKTGVLFLLSYLMALVSWIQVKDIYGKAVVSVSSSLVTIVKDVRVEEIVRNGNVVQVTFTPLRHGADILIDIPIKTSSYAFNVPLTCAIMATFFPYIGRRERAYSQTTALLIFIHLLFVFSYETKEITEIFFSRGLAAVTAVQLAAYQFFWSFMENMVIRFEPFLIGFYMFMRFRK